MMCQGIRAAYTKKIYTWLREWKTNMLLENLQFSYDLKKKIFGIPKTKSDVVTIAFDSKKTIQINLDISEREYDFLKKIGLNILDLIKSFEKANEEKVAITGSWTIAEYKPTYMYEPYGRVVYRYNIYFGNVDTIQSQLA